VHEHRIGVACGRHAESGPVDDGRSSMD
jgi:hypothetical protein